MGNKFNENQKLINKKTNTINYCILFIIIYVNSVNVDIASNNCMKFGAVRNLIL